MYFENFASLVNMGGHGVYVWPTYGLGLLVILYNIFSPLMARKKIVAQIKRQARAASVPKAPSSRDRTIKSKQQVSTAESSRTMNEGEVE